MDILKSLGQEIKFRRNELGLSQEEFAHLCDLHRTYIGSVERGERNISLQNIVIVARTLKCTPSELLMCISGDRSSETL